MMFVITKNTIKESKNNKFLKYLILNLIVLLFSPGFGFSQSFSFPSVNEIIIPNAITIISEGTAEGTPDITIFEFDIVTTSSKIIRSQKYNAEKTQKIIDILNKLGVEKKDIKTVSYRISPYGEYTTTHRLKVVLRNIEKIGEILEEIVKLGISNLSEVKYEVENLDALKNKAYEKAIQIANERAKVLASVGGFKIGKIVAVKEFSNIFQPPLGQPPYVIPM